MVPSLNLYVDDSGSRHPSKDTQASGPDWFGLGGVMIRSSDEDAAKLQCTEFRNRWQPHLGTSPLHSYDIRRRKGEFKWLKQDEAQYAAFVAGITQLIETLPIICTACVIDRPGYANRYNHVYTEEQRWWLCKTAFSVLVERAAKYAKRLQMKLRVFVERSDKNTDEKMRGYYEDLRANGMPFKPENMAKYGPVEPLTFSDVLREFRLKDKSSALMQIADLCLYPVCLSAYNKTRADYRALVAAGKLIDTVLPENDVASMGVKYSCFDRAPTAPGPAPAGPPEAA